MLNTIPESVNDMARAVLENHPNTFNCQCYRKVINRVSDSTMGGRPTIGGLGTVDSEDEENYSYQYLGNGYALQAEPFQPSSMMDRQDANNSFATELRFLICADTNQEFALKKRDVVYLLLGNNVKMAWEITAIETVINVPPFTLRYIMNRRDDIDFYL